VGQNPDSTPLINTSSSTLTTQLQVFNYYFHNKEDVTANCLIICTSKISLLTYLVV